MTPPRSVVTHHLIIHIAINSEEYAHKEHRKWQMN